MRICNSCKWADIARQPKKVILAPGITLRYERGCVICVKPTLTNIARIEGVWCCSDYEQRERKVRKG